MFVVVCCCFLIEKPESAAVSMEGKLPSKAARTRASSNTRCLKDILVWRRRSDNIEDVEVKHTVRSRHVKENVVLQLVWENQDAVAYVKFRSRYLDIKKIWMGALP